MKPAGTTIAKLVRHLWGRTEHLTNDEELAINGGMGSENDVVSPACTICAECETYYEKMYEIPETNSTTTCSSCGSECTKCTIECDISNCEKCSALCERCVPKGNFLKDLGPRTRTPNAKGMVHVVHVVQHDPLAGQGHTCENSDCENPKGLSLSKRIIYK